MPSLWNQVAGVGDHLAGSTDESIGRQFDNTPGGGFADYNTYAGVGDHLAGSTDESIARQFDDIPGGGFADTTANSFWSGAAGLGDWVAGDTDETVGRATSLVPVLMVVGLVVALIGVFANE